MRPRLLFLCHRIPFPPDKGEKIRAWHMLEHLARDWEIELGCLVDDRADLAHLPAMRARFAAVECHAVTRAGRATRTLLRTRPGQPLTLGWFHHPLLAAWVRRGFAARRFDAALVYSSAMAPYAMGDAARGVRRVLDMVDIDSEKWAAYAAAARWPKRQLWAREARTLLAFERAAAAAFDATLFVSRQERDRFVALAPEAAPRAGWVDNGVDLARFDPRGDWPSPFTGPAPAIVFTGTMDYWPNIDAVCWFARAVLPLLRGRAAAPVFHVVGANPAPTVRALAALPGVVVTGRVPDVRPYLAHAAVAVAPLRIARGIQNKVLEAMAMARPVVASPEAFEGVRAMPGRDLLVADGAEAMAQAIGAVLDGAHAGLGAAARDAVLAGHDWGAALAPLDALLRGAGAPRQIDAEAA
jgi:sugar transferase (PEP-CTERM/EpsH1 system associated)